MPATLTVSHEPRMIAGATSFQVTADDSSLIALTVDGEILGVAEGTGSPVNITIAPQTVGTIVKVTVTKFNHYRYDVDIPVVPSNYGHISIASIVLGGLGSNGQINPGETISYGVYAKNMGTQTLQSVYGLLSTADPFISITTDSSWYGNIVEYDSSRSTPDYSFNIANNCPNAHVATLDIEFHDNNDSTWTYNPEITIYAPVLTFQGVSVEGGVCNNGILDPNETANLVVTIMNEGGQDAQDLTATLTTSSPDITILDNSSNYGTVATGSTATNATDPFMVYSSSAIPFGTTIDLAVCLQAGVHVDTLGFSLVVGQSPPTDSFSAPMSSA